MKKGITIFTPTYNRAHTLERLYDSLCRQTSKEFEWLIVDDGSDDETAVLVQKWQQEGRLTIRYLYQANAGKSQAHNLGVENAGFELFSCVDSDDYLVDQAVQRILEVWRSLPNAIGIVCLRGKTSTSPLTQWRMEQAYSTLREAYQSNLIQGDTMLVYQTSIIANYQFPSFKNEKFVPETYLYDQLDQVGQLYFLKEILYIGEYQADGYTASMKKIIAENPRGYEAYIQQRLDLDTRIRDLIADTIRYIAIKLVVRDNSLFKEAKYPGLTGILYPLGFLFFKKSYAPYINRKS
ncbi:glycosyltransferase family A protein [Streptococcus oricebi]|uniref:Glycosyltransferase 2-like domain-containing protein n=1 Tax=Streptococcus oricebi TaxID=1547447 RepID=A0ABS5B5D5_9STRE|nr:glycosyltransferase family 2 protein [Streptococcus oricebi]MBP2623960.1 hypothetical protein [Streptococcus oricebi]